MLFTLISTEVRVWICTYIYMYVFAIFLQYIFKVSWCLEVTPAWALGLPPHLSRDKYNPKQFPAFFTLILADFRGQTFLLDFESKCWCDRYRMLAKTLAWELSTGFRVVLNYTCSRVRCIQNTGTHHGLQRHSNHTGLTRGPGGEITACLLLFTYFVLWNIHT